MTRNKKLDQKRFSYSQESGNNLRNEKKNRKQKNSGSEAVDDPEKSEKDLEKTPVYDEEGKKL